MPKRETQTHYQKRIKNDVQWENFLQSEFDNATWDHKTMGDADAKSRELYKTIASRSGLKPKRTRFYAFAAAATVAVLIGLVAFFNTTNPAINTIAINTTSPEVVKLEDGSLIYLAANTSFEYPAHFDDETRPVKLIKGNAFFDIARDESRPFTITSGKLKTQVLGTSFYIDHRDEQSQVSVKTGSVKVTAEDAELILKPHDIVTLTGSHLSKSKTDDYMMHNWYTEDVQMKNVSLQKITEVLKHKYGVHFSTEDQRVLDTRLTIVVKVNANIKDLINEINFITDLNLTLNDKQLTVEDS